MFTLPVAVVAYAALGAVVIAEVVAYAALGAVVIAEVVAYAALVSNTTTGRTSSHITLLAEVAKARKHLVHKVCTTFSSLTDNF